MKREERRRKSSGEGVVVEEQGLEVEEGGKVRNRPGERVVLETQDSELVQAS